MAPSIVRGVFLAAAFAVLAQAVSSWWEPGLTVIHGSGGYQPLAPVASAELRARLPSDPQGLLMLVGLVQGLRS